MTHIQTIPARTLQWEHGLFEGRQQGDPTSPVEEKRLRWWGVCYGAFGSAEDAKWLRNPVLPLVPSRVYGPICDRFYWNPDSGEHEMTKARVYQCVRWYFTGNPTAAELALTENMEFCRARMAGAELFSGTPYAFTVTELPAERAEEE